MHDNATMKPSAAPCACSSHDHDLDHRSCNVHRAMCEPCSTLVCKHQQDDGAWVVRYRNMERATVCASVQRTTRGTLPHVVSAVVAQRASGSPGRLIKAEVLAQRSTQRLASEGDQWSSMAHAGDAMPMHTYLYMVSGGAPHGSALYDVVSMQCATIVPRSLEATGRWYGAFLTDLVGRGTSGEPLPDRPCVNDRDTLFLVCAGRGTMVM